MLKRSLWTIVLTGHLLGASANAALASDLRTPGTKPIGKVSEVVRLTPLTKTSAAFRLPRIDLAHKPGFKPILKTRIRPVFLADDPRHRQSVELVITAVGDAGFARGGQRGRAQGIYRGSGLLSYDRALRRVKPLVDGDLNFFNLETVVSAKALPATGKRFVFQSHPNSLKAMVNAGFNLAALANNHSYDSGWIGMRETIAHVKNHPDLIAAGLGLRSDAARPTRFNWQDSEIAFNAMSFLSHPFRATDTRVGQLNLRNTSDVNAVIAGFKASDADFKILSLHAGQELAPRPEPQNRAIMYRFIEEGGVDLIIAHHPHIMRPVERHPSGAVIFHSLGNFLLVGAANINNRGVAVDWGGLAKIYLQRGNDGGFALSALEMHPLKDLHFSPRPLSAPQNSARIKALNRLTVSALPKTGVRWKLTETGTGVACFATDVRGPRATALCPDQLADAAQ